MRYVTRNPFARLTIRSERVMVTGVTNPPNPYSCAWCGSVRGIPGNHWLLRFHVDADSARESGPIADGRLFCSRSCVESYTDRKLGE